jgi:O-antigen/teichoic acid export membrane protein
MVYFVKGGSWLTLGQITSSMLTFFLAISFANLLPKETYGAYKYALSIAGILAISTLSGMNTALSQAVARGYEGSMKTALKIKIHWGLLGLFSGLALALYYYINSNVLLAVSFLIISIFIPFFDSFSIYNSLLTGKKLFNVSTKYNIATYSTLTASIILTIYLTDNLLIILLVYFISITLLRYIFFKITTNKWVSNINKDMKTISYGKHLSIVNVISILSIHIDKILIFHYVGASQLATYAFAIAIPEQIKGLLKVVSNLALPKFAKNKITYIKSSFFKKLSVFNLLVFVGVIAYILIAPELYSVLFPQYSDSIFLSQIFAISLVATNMIPRSIFESQAALKQLYILKIFSSTVNISLMLILFFMYGILGVIIGKVLARFITYFLSLFMVAKLK